MGFGKLFKRSPSTPTTSKGSKTPPTTSSPASSRRSKRGSRYSGKLPAKNLLSDLNVSAEDDGHLELVLGEIGPSPESQPATPVAAKDEQSEDSSLKPRKLDIEEPEVKEGDAAAPETSEAVTPEATAPDETKKEEEAGVAQTFMGFLETAQQLATGIVSEETIRKLVPTADNDLCQPIGGRRARSDISGIDGSPVRLERQYSYYNDQFALKFLDELLNVGYALVHHEQGTDEDADWVGRSVTLILRPGICNAIQVQAPCLEWTTMGGGQQEGTSSTVVSLLDIHSISTSYVENMAGLDDDENDKEATAKEQQPQTQDDEEDLRCFFTVTTKQGKVYVMEAITADESQRLVAGVKNLAARLSRQLIAGDDTILPDFFDNADEPDEIRFSIEEAMLQLSNTLLDDLS